MSLIWAEFSDNPALPHYQKLKAHADRVKQWLVWREKALVFVRDKISKNKNENNRYSWKPDHRERVHARRRQPQGG